MVVHGGPGRVLGAELSRPANGAPGFCDHCQRDCVDVDVCLGAIVGVVEACCGHGWVVSPYVVQRSGTRLEQRAAIQFFTSQGVGPVPVQTVVAPMFWQYDDKIQVGVEYDAATLALVGIRWRNNTAGDEPTWAFDRKLVKLVVGGGTAPLAGSVTVDADGIVHLPFKRVETVADGG